MSALTSDDILAIRSELIAVLIDRAKAGELAAVAECRKLLRDQAHDIFERDARQRSQNLFGGLMAAGKRANNDNGNV